MHLKKNIKIGEFLCSHFSIEDGRKYATFSVCYTFIISRKVKTTDKQKEKIIYAAYGEGAMTDRMCQKWFAKFLGTIPIVAK